MVKQMPQDELAHLVGFTGETKGGGASAPQPRSLAPYRYRILERATSLFFNNFYFFYVFFYFFLNTQYFFFW